jgi:predicted ATPase
MLRLLQLKLLNHPIIGDLDLDLSNNVEKDNNFYTTVFIGPNGTGKSYLLQAIVNIFREVSAYLVKKERKVIVNGSFYLKYIYDKKTIELFNSSFVQGRYSEIHPPEIMQNLPFNFLINKKASDDISVLPNKILASSMIFTDKFPAVDDKNLLQYRYLGVRNINSPSSAGTRVINSKVVDSLTSSLGKPGFLNTLKKVLKDLNYTPSIKVEYFPKYRNIFFKKELTVESFSNSFTDWGTTFKYRKSEPWGSSYFKSIKEDSSLLKKIVHFLNTKEFITSKRAWYFQYDLLEKTTQKDEYEILAHLHKLDLVTFPNIQLVKTDNTFGISESSSGEQNILFSLLTLLANVETKSIILIDEPELSLHPNWQMQYFHILRDVFKNYKDLHFLVATHSHFLISDVKGENSKIIGLKKEDNKIKTINFSEDLNTFGWSAEDVLYNIFNVRSSLNYYLKADLTELLGIISNGIKDAPKVEEILRKLKELPKRNNDPLQEIILEATEYLNTIS